MIGQIFLLGLSLGIVNCASTGQWNYMLGCRDKPYDIMYFLQPAQVDNSYIAAPDIHLTIEPSTNVIGPGEERTVVLRGLDDDKSHFMLQAKDKNGKLAGSFPSVDNSVRVFQCEGNYDTVHNVKSAGSRRTEFRFKWRAPTSWDGVRDSQGNVVFSFYWQVKGPKQVGTWKWGTQYKVVKDMDLVYTSSSGTSAPSGSLIALGTLQLALAQLAL